MRYPIKYLFLALVFMAACVPQNKNEIEKQLGLIQQKYIVDKRLEYFKVDCTQQEKEFALVGATVSEKAFSELAALAEENSISFDVTLLPTKEFNENPWGVVTISVCNIRGEGRHSAELVTQALMGTPVKVYQKLGGWYLVQTPDRYFGWVDDSAIALKPSSELNTWKAMKKVLYNKVSGFGYAKASLDSEIETDLVLADLLSIQGEENEFYKSVLGDGRVIFVLKQECVSLEEWQARKLDVNKVLATAASFKGVPYLWGGTSAKMVDCSGFTKTAYYRHGLILQRDASQQTLYGELVDTEKSYTTLLPGDLVFFGRKATGDRKEKVTHVGLSLGNQEFIHASGKVRINSLNSKSPAYTKYYETAFVRGRRITTSSLSDGIEWVVDNSFYQQILSE